MSDPSTSPTTGDRNPGIEAKTQVLGLAESYSHSATAASVVLPALPSEIGGYKILRLLGVGGMGIVYAAQDPVLDREIALKILKPEFAAVKEARKRFAHEARAAAKIEHDAIVPIYSVGEANGVPFITMPLLQGVSLDDWLQRHGVAPAPWVVWLGREVAEGLAAAHATGLVHRDIKPANIWIEVVPGADGHPVLKRARILDFGLARSYKDDRLTQTGTVMGTPAYMAPEQARGLPVDARADIFSLGLVLYRMLVGKNPYERGDVYASLTALAVDVLPPAHVVQPQVPLALSYLIARMTVKDPALRISSAIEVARELTRLLDPAHLYAPPLSGTFAPIVTPIEPLPSLTAPIEPLTPPNTPIESSDSPFVGLAEELATAPPPPKPKSSIFAAKPDAQRLGISLIALAAIVLCLVLWRMIPQGQGTLVLGSDDDTARVRILQQGRVIRDNVPPGLLKLPPGRYEIGWLEPSPHLELSTSSFQISEGENTYVWITRAKGDRNRNLRSDAGLEPARIWEDRVAKLPLAEQIAAVEKRYQQMYPGKFSKFREARIEAETIPSLSIDTEVVTDLTPLKVFKHIHWLDLTPTNRPGTGRLTDLTPLQSIHIRQLILAHNPELKNLLPLRSKAFELLDLQSTGVSDLSPLAQSAIRELNLYNTPIVDFRPLHEIQGLVDLTIGGRPTIDRLDFLRGLRLNRLQANDAGFRDLSPLQGMPLSALSIVRAPVGDLSPLRGMRLRELNLRGVPATDLQPLRGMFLETLDCDERPEIDYTPLRSIRTLSTINGKPAAMFAPKK